MLRWLLLLATLVPLLGLYRDIPSECAVGMYLPPMPGSPQSDGQIISYRTAAEGTFRLRYGTSANKLAEYADGGASGQLTTADTRDDFTLSGLSANTKYHWLVECSEGGKWKRGWRGSFITTPSSGGTVKIVFGTDMHYPGFAINPSGEKSAFASRTMKGIHLMSRHVQDAHVYIDGGDTFMIHHRTTGGYAMAEDFGRSFGDFSITDSAQTEAEEDAFAEARYSFGLRRFHIFLRFVPSILVRGNHDAGGASGGNWDFNNGHLWQLRARPWVPTGIDVDLSADVSNGVFTVAAHGIADGAGPFRLTDTNPPTGITELILDDCGGARAATDDGNEWYVRDIDGDSFYLAYTAVAAGCTTSGGGAGDATLLRGSDMQSASRDVIAEYLPLQNTVYPHGWGGATTESHYMGPVPLSDHTLVITMDLFDFSGIGTCASYPVRFPSEERIADCGWSLGSDQLAGVLAEIAEIQDGGGDYEDVETLILVSHSHVGGFGNVGYSYGRGSLCEVDTVCDVGGADCIIDSDCVSGDCGTQTCSDAFAHPEMVSIQAAAAAMVTRSSGIAIWLAGHDHQFTLGEKGSSGVYYLKGGQVGGSFAGFNDGEMEKRYDFDADGIPAYRRHYCALEGGAYCPAGTQNALVELGSEHRGFSIIEVTPAAENGGKTKVEIDYIINGYDDYPEIHGDSAGGFPVVIEGD